MFPVSRHQLAISTGPYWGGNPASRQMVYPFDKQHSLAETAATSAAERETGEVARADEAHSVQPGTSGWARLGGQEAAR